MPYPHVLAPRLCLAVLAGSLVLVGCGGGSSDPVIMPAAATTVGAKSFSFASGAVLDARLASQPATLAFNASASQFSIAAPTGRATGSNTFGSCILTVGGSADPNAPGGGSSFPPGAGPQSNDIIRLNTCEVNTDTNTLNVTNSSGASASGSGGGSTGGSGG